jgi:hypothetical protein
MSLRKSAVRRADAAHQAAVQTTTNAKAAPITISVFTPTIAMPRSALAARNQGHGCAAMRSIGAADLRDVTGRNVTFGAEARNKRLVLWLAGDARRIAVGRASVWLPPKSLNRSGDSSVKLELVATRRATGRGLQWRAAGGARSLRSQKQKDADQQTCSKCPEA